MANCIGCAALSRSDRIHPLITRSPRPFVTMAVLSKDPDKGDVVSEHLKKGREAFLRIGDQVYLSEILGAAKKQIWVSFPDTDPPSTGDGVTLEVHEEDGFVRYHTHVAATADPTSGLTLERAQTSGLLKHRQSFRVPYTVEIGVESEIPAAISKARLIDISEQGARVESEAKWEVGEPLTLQISLQQMPALPFPARIVYANPPMNLGGKPQYGFRFSELPSDSRRMLTEFLAKEIAERYPDELRAMYPRSKRRKR